MSTSKKHNIITLIIAISMMITLISCSQKANSVITVGNYNDIEYPRFQTTDWGMSPEDAFKALKIDKADVKMETIVTDDMGTGSSTVNICNLTVEVAGTPISTELTFTTDPVGVDLGLTHVSFDIPSQKALDEITAITKDARYYKKSMYDIGTENSLLDEIRPQYEYSHKTAGSQTEEMSKDEWLKSFEAYHKQSYLADVTISDGGSLGSCKISGIHAATFKTLFPQK